MHQSSCLQCSVRHIPVSGKLPSYCDIILHARRSAHPLTSRTPGTHVHGGPEPASQIGMRVAGSARAKSLTKGFRELTWASQVRRLGIRHGGADMAVPARFQWGMCCILCNLGSRILGVPFSWVPCYKGSLFRGDPTIWRSIVVPYYPKPPSPAGSALCFAK